MAAILRRLFNWRFPPMVMVAVAGGLKMVAVAARAWEAPDEQARLWPLQKIRGG
jgi:hypothetical protein